MEITHHFHQELLQKIAFYIMSFQEGAINSYKTSTPSKRLIYCTSESYENGYKFERIFGIIWLFPGKDAAEHGFVLFTTSQYLGR